MLFFYVVRVIPSHTAVLYNEKRISLWIEKESGMEDRKLIKLINRNPEKGISIALDLYGDPVKTICSSILAGMTAQDVEEAVAETFVRLWRYGKSFKAERGTSLKSYIYSIARNASLDKLKAVHGAEVSIEAIDNFRFPDDELNIEDLIIKQEEAGIVKDVVYGLDEPERTIFVMRYFYELKVKEIAERLQLPAKTVENKLHRTKAVLRAKFEEKEVR